MRCECVASRTRTEKFSGHDENCQKNAVHRESYMRICFQTGSVTNTMRLRYWPHRSFTLRDPILLQTLVVCVHPLFFNVMKMKQVVRLIVVYDASRLHVKNVRQKYCYDLVC